ncbi:hypothetical protein [Taibaiella chishuiensis]|uniref:hypothetical protein n=1 Tax=Taibaiella chishuiensis TaxID=1434707 RepID=UPI0011B1F0AE|nr:hypothetical protein [Taibaiella chishuiensis]
MIRKIILIGLLLYAGSSAHAQKDSLSALFSSADKIEILSHQDLYLPATTGELRQGINGHWRSLADASGNLNTCIVVRRLELKEQEKRSLAKILFDTSQPGIPPDKASCFLPHQAIVMYRKGKCFLIDLCFDCRRFSSSEQILLPNGFLLTDEQWYKLEHFFIARGIRPNIEDKSG